MTRVRRFAASALLALASIAGTGCDDPIIIVGDLPGIMRQVAGVPNRIGTRVDTLARNTQLSAPRGIAVADDGTLYIADTGNGRIVAVRPTGHATLLASAAGCTDACLVEPHGIAVAPDGAVWIADAGAHRIFRLDPDSRELEVRAGNGLAATSPDFTPALEASINAPGGIAITDGGIVYFSERDGHVIRWITSQGTLRTLAGTGVAGYSEGSPATNAQLDTPAGLAIAAGLLYVADEANHRVREINIGGGGIRTIAGNGVPAYSETDTIAASAKLNRPRGVALTDDRARLFIADAFNDRVRVVHLPTGRIRSFAGMADDAYNGEGHDAGETALASPSDVAVFGDLLFIADTDHQIVWRTPLQF